MAKTLDKRRFFRLTSGTYPKRPSRRPPRFKNFQGATCSPRVALLREQMIAQHDLDAWDNKRVDRLCQALGVTLEGLCAAAGVFNPVEVQRLRRQAAQREEREAAWRVHANNLNAEGRLPLSCMKSWKWPWPIALHFARIERFIYEQRFLTPSQVSPEDAYLAQICEQAKTR